MSRFEAKTKSHGGSRSHRAQAGLAAALFAAGLLALGGCAANRPLVKGFFDEGGTIYRGSEQEEWGTRSTVNVGLDF